MPVIGLGDHSVQFGAGTRRLSGHSQAITPASGVTTTIPELASNGSCPHHIPSFNLRSQSYLGLVVVIRLLESPFMPTMPMTAPKPAFIPMSRALRAASCTCRRPALLSSHVVPRGLRPPLHPFQQGRRLTTAATPFNRTGTAAAGPLGRPETLTILDHGIQISSPRRTKRDVL